jgi:ribose/xylose/arabinose/galactoside ABC-type transport system permease subunit
VRIPAFWRTRESGTALILAAMLVACEIATRVNTGDSFLFSGQAVRVVGESAYIGIAAIGACIVILSGGVDLSPGSVMGLGGMAMGYSYGVWGWPAPAALLLGLSTGTAVGFLNGLLVGQVRLPPFIATLGFLSIARGLNYWMTGGITVPLEWRGSPPRLFTILGEHPVLTMLALGALASVLLARFSWGRYVYAVGGSEEAARFAGLPVERVKIGVYAVAGLLAALAGCAYDLNYASSHVSHGGGYELQIIAACAVGGVSFSGGQGSVAGALLGAVSLRVLYTLLTRLKVPGERIEIAYGAAIILAVAVDQFRQGQALRRWFGRKAT